ncbi:hypothetical protein CDAR_116311 [Caerostris darwini]|uniref:Uncharacterized protein n=1 Tax=Caerostris darwini TaxID=1538125 RepID=A0AAV4WLI0_9ARAC|nr:hypothetical protein CDAR_116311 [Caerostris darwini]
MGSFRNSNLTISLYKPQRRPFTVNYFSSFFPPRADSGHPHVWQMARGPMSYLMRNRRSDCIICGHGIPQIKYGFQLRRKWSISFFTLLGDINCVIKDHVYEEFKIVVPRFAMGNKCKRWKIFLFVT